MSELTHSAPTHSRAYGTAFASQLPLIGFEPSDQPADVEIVLGDVPLSIDAPGAHGMFWSATSHEVLFDVPGLMRVYVADGRRITVAPAGASDSDTILDIELLLTGTPIAAALMQRGEMVLHGSAALVEGGALVVTGLNGSGKSSVVSALSTLGLPIVCDNLAVMSPASRLVEPHDTSHGGEWLVQPGPSTVKLWHDMAVALDRPVETGARISADVNKYRFDVPATRLPVPVRAVVHLERAAVGVPQLSRLTDAEATVMLMRDHFRGKIARLSRPGALADSASLAQAVPVYSCLRPADGIDPGVLAQFILGGLE